MRSEFALGVVLVACVAGACSAEPPMIEPGHIVRSMLLDANGNSWFGTDHHGVYRFDGHTLERFTADDGLADNQVREIVEDGDGSIWFATASGISRFDGNAFRTPVERAYSTRNNWQLGPDDLWFKGDRPSGMTEREGTPGVFRYDGSTFWYHAFPGLEDLGNDGSVTGIHQAGAGRVWFSTYGAVIGFDGRVFVTIDDESLGHTAETGFLHARCVFEDSRGRVWIGNNGIGVLLREGDTTVNFTQAMGVGRREKNLGGRTKPLPGDAPEGEPAMHRVFAIGEDRRGHIWFGTIEHGAWRYDGESLRRFTVAEGLTTNTVRSIYGEANGELWIGGEGVFVFDGERFERRF